eukprot:gb/GECG01003564.1/.p1 GENE.gb/GECG01003564.1/~~gb/GECG01003564.1/.p1  ORF type:complete len:135 (+),score=2.34 gb/GECG01003564.1/:1-405(+)
MAFILEQFQKHRYGTGTVSKQRAYWKLSLYLCVMGQWTRGRACFIHVHVLPPRFARLGVTLRYTRTWKKLLGAYLLRGLILSIHVRTVAASPTFRRMQTAPRIFGGINGFGFAMVEDRENLYYQPAYKLKLPAK